MIAARLGRIISAPPHHSAERRESMVEVLSVFNVVVLQHAMVALSHKLPGTHQLSVYLHKEEQPVSLKGPDVRASQLHVIDVLLTDYMARVDYPVPQLSQLVLRVLAFVVR
jgi:hypothetical protein